MKGEIIPIFEIPFFLHLFRPLPFLSAALTQISMLRINCISYQLLGKQRIRRGWGGGAASEKKGGDRERGDFYHLMKNSFPFGQNFIGLQSSPGPHFLTCNRGKSSQHLLIIFPWLLSFQRVSYHCQRCDGALPLSPPRPALSQ